MVQQKNLNPKNQTEPIQKNNTESEPKLVKYLDQFKILVSRKPKQNMNINISDIRIYPKQIYIPRCINYFQIL